MNLRNGALLVVMTVVAGGLVVFGFSGAAYALGTPSISTSQQPVSAVVGSSIADKATVSGSSSSFTCPAQDMANFPLGVSNTSSSPIFCSYPAFQGENPNDFFCDYSATTGALVTDNDAGFCPANAVAAGPSTNPTGTVTFRLYNNNTGSGTPLFTDTETLVSGVATSAGYTAMATGTDYWVATYSGDINNNPVTSSNSGEPVTITPASPSLSGSGGGSVTLGSSVSDLARIGGGYSPLGSVSFAVFPGGGCTGTEVGSTKTVPVSGDKTYPSGSIATPASAGTYSVLVSYTPDANNSAPPKVCDPYRVMPTPPSSVSAPFAPPPSMTGLSQTHRRWRLGNKLARFAAVSKLPIGTTFQFTLNEAATLRFVFAQLLPGRKVRGKCVAQTQRNRRHKACTRSVSRGSLSFSAGVGLHKLFFQGRLTRTQKLKPGTYALTITATNAAGQRATSTLSSFAIVRG